MSPTCFLDPQLRLQEAQVVRSCSNPFENDIEEFGFDNFKATNSRYVLKVRLLSRDTNSDLLYVLLDPMFLDHARATQFVPHSD